MLTLEQRYKLYQKALKDWQIARWIPRIFRHSTSYGFCMYFEESLRDLLELYAQKPNYLGYWFNPGKCKPRIAVLKAAIKECEQQLYKELKS